MEKPKYSEIYDFENLYEAAKETCAGKRYFPAELRFTENFEANLIEIQNELIWHTYKMGKYSNFYVYDPKKRLISAPGLRDRIVQTALCRVVERYIEPRLDFGSYACRVGRGTLAAAEKAAYFASRCQHFAYFDIKGFFDNIPIKRLLDVYKARFIDDDEILGLLNVIFKNECEGGIGIKKGCRTSQLSANVYLNELDHFLRHNLKVRRYVRYMDDFLIFDDDAERLERIKEDARGFLERELFLELNEKSYIGAASRGFEFIGYKIFPKYKIVRKLVLERGKRDFKRWKSGKISDEAFYKGAASRAGHLEGTSSYKWMCGYLLDALRFALTERK